MNILILSNKEDAHAIHLNLALQKEGATVYYLDASFFHTSYKVEDMVFNMLETEFAQ